MLLSEKEQRFFSSNAEKSGGDRQTPDKRSGQRLKILSQNSLPPDSIYHKELEAGLVFSLLVRGEWITPKLLPHCGWN